MRILNIEPLRYNSETRTLLNSIGDVDYVDVQTQKELIKLLGQSPYEALFVKLGIAVDPSVLKATPGLKYIVTPTTGLNHIDLEETSKRDIQIISLKGETAFLRQIKSTAEHTWGLLMALIRKIPFAVKDVAAYHWRREPFLASELNGKTLGIIGYGRLGQIVAGYGLAFGMRVLVNDTDPNRYESMPEDIEPVNLDFLLNNSHIISLHISYEPKNYHFLDHAKLAQMHRGAILINTSRGELVDESALVEALQKKHIGGAALDVLEGDSGWELNIPSSNALVEYAKENNNLLITPHIGGYALESIEGTRKFITEKFQKAISQV